MTASEEGHYPDDESALPGDLPGMWEPSDLQGGEADTANEYGERPEVSVSGGQVVHGASLGPGDDVEKLRDAGEEAQTRDDGIEVSRNDFTEVLREARERSEPEPTSSVQISLWVGNRCTQLEKSWPVEIDQSRHAEALRELSLLAEELIEGERL